MGSSSAREVIALGLLLAVPDLLLCLGEVKGKGEGAALPRLFLSAAALIAFVAVAGLNPIRSWNAYASLLGSLGLTVFFIAVVVVLILATSVPRSLRIAG